MLLHTCGKMLDRFADVTSIIICTCKLVNHTWNGARQGESLHVTPNILLTDNRKMAYAR